MSAGKSPAATPLVRDDSEDRCSLARIAARMLAVAELVDQALEEIDRIASGIERAVRIKYLLLAVVSGIFSAFTLTGLLVWIVAGLTGTDLGWRPMLILVPMIVLAAGSVLTWRVMQYGFGPIRTKRQADYPVGATASIETLEKLFDHLGRRSGPRAYCRTRLGEKHYLSHRIFWGRCAACCCPTMPAIAPWCFRPWVFTWAARYSLKPRRRTSLPRSSPSGAQSQAASQIMPTLMHSST